MKKTSGFKMKAGKEGPMRKNFPSAFKAVDPPSDKDEWVSYTDTNYQPDWGGTTVTPYETKVTKGTKRLIEAGAPKDVIAKSKLRDIDRKSSCRERV